MADPAASITVAPLNPATDPNLQIPTTEDPMLTLLRKLVTGDGSAPAAPPASAATQAAPRLARPASPPPAAASTAPASPASSPASAATRPPAAPTAPAANTNAALSPDMAALLQSLPPEYRAAFAARLANDAATTKAITDSQNQRSDLIKKMIDERPPVLSGIDHAFAAPPPAPDVQPLKAFQNFGVALALLGSLLTRRPLTSALKSGAAAMDAYNKGQYREYAIQRQNWLDNVDLAIKQNQLEIDKYRAAQDAYRDDMDKMQLAMEQIAADNHDTIALQQMKNGQIDDFLQLIQHRDDMAQRYAMANMRYRLGGGPLTRGQAMHDDQIFKAQDDLQSLYGIDWQDPKALENIYTEINKNGGFVDARTRDILTKWKLAHEPTYEGMSSLPALGRGEKTPANTGGDSPPWPSQYASDEEGHIRTSPDGRHWRRHGDKAIEVDENGKPIEANMAPAIPATPSTTPPADSGGSKWWPGNW